MTRAKPKPTIATREPAKQPIATGSKAARALRAAAPEPGESSLKAPTTKANPAKAGASKTRKVATPPNAVTKKPATAKAAAALKTVPAKSATAKVTASNAKATPKPVAEKPAAAKASAAKAVAPKLDTPAKLRPIEQAVGVSSDAVARRTGKSWAQWFALLDAAGAAELDHKGIVAVLAQRHGVGPWWQQMVTVAYEQARGKNGNTATDDGFQVDVSKVLELPLAKLFRFWAEPSERNKWLADDRFSIHKATASKSIRARWGRGVSRIDVDFCEKGPSKSQVTVQHNRIETSDAAEQMKAYWAKKIRALEALTRP